MRTTQLRHKMKASSTHPRVSIIITTYNGSNYIGETIESVLAQDFRDWELIVVDDGSTDSTREIVRSFKDERINLIEAGRIGINGMVKNIGLDHSQGEYIAFIDHDDLWHQSKLSKQVKALDENPELGFCMTGGYNFRERGVPCEYFYSQREGEWSGSVFQALFESRLSVWTQALLIRRTCVDEVGGFSKDAKATDPFFIAEIACRFNALIIYQPLVFRRLHNSNYSIHNWEEGQVEGIAMIRKYAASKDLSPVVARKALFRSYIHAGEKYLRVNKPWAAMRNFISACRQQPMNLIPWKKMGKAIVWSIRRN